MFTTHTTPTRPIAGSINKSAPVHSRALSRLNGIPDAPIGAGDRLTAVILFTCAIFYLSDTICTMAEPFDTWKFLAGLGIFLFGMYFVELSLKDLAGRSFKKFLRKHTTNPVKGILAGTLVTMLLQSSSVVSLMVLAFVGAGILQLRNAIGIIFGSNLGTTFTGWIVTALGFKVHIESFALPFIAVGGLSMMLLSNREKLLEIGRFLLGFGFLFLGLEFMKTSVGNLASTVDMGLFASWDPYWFFLVGFVLTAIIQSSSAAMVITLSALNAGVISLEAAAAMVIGNDLGTTITVILGAIKGAPSKKRVATSHFLFNLVTDLLALALLYPLLKIITQYVGVSDPLYTLVFFHSAFNLIGIALLLPFIGLFARFLESRFTNGTEQVSRFIGTVPPNVAEAAVEALNKDIRRLIDKVFLLNITALRINPGLFTFPDDVKDLPRGNRYRNDYASVKQMEGELVEYYLYIQNEKLENSESELLNRSIHAVRNAVISAKGVKDIMHNIRDFASSSNDAKRGLYLYSKGLLNEFYLSLHQIFHSPNAASYFEQLAGMLSENQMIYERFLKEIYRQIQGRLLDDEEISTLLNVNREIFNANRALILAIKDLLLQPREAADFNNIPEMR